MGKKSISEHQSITMIYVRQLRENSKRGDEYWGEGEERAGGG